MKKTKKINKPKELPQGGVRQVTSYYIEGGG